MQQGCKLKHSWRFSAIFTATGRFHVIAVGHQSTALNTAISASRYSNGNWATPQTISEVVSPQRAAVVADDAGNVTAAWIQHTGAYYGVRASRYSNGTWSTPVTVAGANSNAFRAGAERGHRRQRERRLGRG